MNWWSVHGRWSGEKICGAVKVLPGRGCPTYSEEDGEEGKRSVWESFNWLLGFPNLLYLILQLLNLIKQRLNKTWNCAVVRNVKLFWRSTFSPPCLFWKRELQTRKCSLWNMSMVMAWCFVAGGLANDPEHAYRSSVKWLWSTKSMWPSWLLHLSSVESQGFSQQRMRFSSKL